MHVRATVALRQLRAMGEGGAAHARDIEESSLGHSARLQRALEAMGIANDRPQLDHRPPLGLRRRTEVYDGTVVYDPPANDPDHLEWITYAEHRRRTGGRKGEKRSTSYGSDMHAMAKLDRLTKPKRPRGSIPSRPFQKGPKRPWPSRPWPLR